MDRYQRFGIGLSRAHVTRPGRVSSEVQVNAHEMRCIPVDDEYW